MQPSESNQLTERIRQQWGRTVEQLNHRGRTLTRNEVAKTVHEFIRDVLGEPDESSIDGALVLKDLLDCGTCVQHIAQVYLKGIMDPVCNDEFRGRQQIDREELNRIDIKVSERIDRAITGDVPGGCSMGCSTGCTGDALDIRHILNKRCSNRYLNQSLIIDVREKYAFDSKHVPGAINIPLREYALNPHLAGNDTHQHLIFVCEMGQTAQLAAEYARAAGYNNVTACKMNE